MDTRETAEQTLDRARTEGRWCRWGCGLAGCRNCETREVTVDGFTYSTTAPERRISRTAQHYVTQAQDAAAQLRTPVLDDVLARAEAAVR